MTRGPGGSPWRRGHAFRRRGRKRIGSTVFVTLPRTGTHVRMHLTMQEHERDGVRVIAVLGEIDIASAPQLSTRLNVAVRCTSGGVVVDLSGVEFIDSTGIAVLLNALRRMTRARRRLALVCAPGPVMRALRTARLDTTFTVRESVREAVRAALPQVPRSAVA